MQFCICYKYEFIYLCKTLILTEFVVTSLMNVHLFPVRWRWQIAQRQTGPARTLTPSLMAGKLTSTWPTWEPNLEWCSQVTDSDVEVERVITVHSSVIFIIFKQNQTSSLWVYCVWDQKLVSPLGAVSLVHCKATTIIVCGEEEQRIVSDWFDINLNDGVRWALYVVLHCTSRWLGAGVHSWPVGKLRICWVMCHRHRCTK